MNELTFQRYDGREVTFYNISGIESVTASGEDPNASSIINMLNGTFYHVVGTVEEVRQKIRGFSGKDTRPYIDMPEHIRLLGMASLILRQIVDTPNNVSVSSRFDGKQILELINKINKVVL